MNRREVQALLVLASGAKTTKELAEPLGVTYSRASQIVRRLEENGLVSKAGTTVELADTVQGTLFRRIAPRFDPIRLLRGPNAEVAATLQEKGGLAEIERRTGLSYWTLRRSLVDLMQIGAVIEEGEGAYTLTDDDELRLFLRMLRVRELKMLAEPSAKIVYSGGGSILKTVPLGESAEGTPTAFSAFGRYGVELRTTRQYLFSPPQ